MAHVPVGMILAAGYGTRLYPLTLTRPKPILEVAAKPIIYFIIKMLEDAGIKDIFINLHHQPEQVRFTLSRYRFRARLHFTVEKHVLNTAGGVANVVRRFGIANRKMVVVHGDIVCALNLATFFETDHFVSLICEEDRQVEDYISNVGIAKDNRVIRLGQYYDTAKPTMKRGFFTGIQILSKEAILLLAACTNESLVADMYPRWLREGRDIMGFVRPFFYNDLGTAKRLLDSNIFLLANSLWPLTKHFLTIRHLSKNVYVHGSVSIDKKAVLCGPALIANGACIGPYASIGPNVVIGERSAVLACARVTNSVIMSDTIIDKEEILDRTISLDRARVGVKPLPTFGGHHA